MKSSSKVERFDYSKFKSDFSDWYSPELGEYEFWGIHPKEGKFRIDTKRYKEVCEGFGITEFMPQGLCKESNVSINYINNETDFTFEFSRIGRNIVPNGVINGTINGTINENEKIVLDIILKNPNITIAEMANQSNKSIRTINRIINSLKEKNLLKRMNSNKDGYWEVLK